MGAPEAGSDQMRTMLAQPEKIRFLADFSEWIESRPAGKIAAVHAALCKGVKDGTLPDRHAREARELTEQRWSQIDPKGLVNLYLDSRERDNRSIEILAVAFQEWARREPEAAWTRARAIEGEDWRRTACVEVIRETSRAGTEKIRALIKAIPDLIERDSLLDDLAAFTEAPKPASDSPEQAFVDPFAPKPATLNPFDVKAIRSGVSKLTIPQRFEFAEAVAASATPSLDCAEIIQRLLHGNGMTYEAQLAFAERTPSLLLRREALLSLSKWDAPEPEYSRIQSLIEALPAAYHDHLLDARRLGVLALRDPAKVWDILAKRNFSGYGDPGCASQAMEAWWTYDPQAAWNALLTLGPTTKFTNDLGKILLAASNDDPSEALDRLRAMPYFVREASLSDVLDRLAGENPGVDCAISLGLEDAVRRHQSGRYRLYKWLSDDPAHAAAWVGCLPPGNERLMAVSVLASNGGNNPGTIPAMDALVEGILPDPAYRRLVLSPSATESREAPLAARLAKLDEIRMSIRALTRFEPGVMGQEVDDMPEGLEKDMARLGQLDRALADGHGDQIAERTKRLLHSPRRHLAESAASARINAIPLDHPEQAMEFARSLDAPDTRFAAASAIVVRWSAPAHRAVAESVVRGFPESWRRRELALRWIAAQRVPERDPEKPVAPEWLTPALRQGVLSGDLTDFAFAWLDHRYGDALRAAAGLPEAEARSLVRRVWVRLGTDEAIETAHRSIRHEPTRRLLEKWRREENPNRK